LSEVPEAVDRAATGRAWERGRKAWNLPRAPRDVRAASTTLADEVATAADVQSTTADRTIQRLPDDISELGRDELRKASDARDERLSPLFRRWPALSRVETKEIQLLHDERQRLARRIGLLRTGRRR
jgi:hypothetical protein